MVAYPVDVLVTVLAALLFIVGLTGIVLPVLPGTLTLVVTMLVWAILIGGWPSWVAFSVVLVLSVIGMTASYVLTGKRLKSRQVPTWAILLGIAGAIVGFFVIPVLGIPLGFMIGLYLAELSRLQNARTALDSTVVALKAIGLGILVELACAFGSSLALAVAAIVHFTQS
ncbi:DUF456 domain-containing protein [Brachybacterium sp. EF45031]|uniref:DUF456 domain-containing protein n=1 Tax=Brachybacterium sillae TaxID=2810536 RepID=UPI00217CDDB7|nr:DUF456 domain-containing protein [Brachybacterium sillae]MCS6711477.1 DUF456 domain-containing protein [Brachybacterium sillae]